jgi:hypothetical protein
MNALGIISCIAFFPLVVALVVAADWISARLSGWHRLQQRYAADRQSSSKVFERVSVQVNTHWYTAKTDVSFNGDGLRIAMHPSLARFHAPILVPWDDVTPLQDGGDENEFRVRIGESARVTLAAPMSSAMARIFERRGLTAGGRSRRRR